MVEMRCCLHSDEPRKMGFRLYTDTPPYIRPTTEWAGDSRWPWMIGAAEIRQRQVEADRRYSSAELECNFVLRRACLHQFRRDEFEADQHECIEAFGEFLVLCWYRMGCDGDAMLPEWRTAWKRSVKAASQAFQAHWLDRCDVKPQIFWPCTKNYPISMSMDSTRSLDFAFQSPKSLAKWFLISKSTLPSHEMHWIFNGILSWNSSIRLAWANC